MAAYPGCVALRDELYDAASSRAKAGHYKDRKGDNPSLMKSAAAKSISLSLPPPPFLWQLKCRDLQKAEETDFISLLLPDRIHSATLAHNFTLPGQSIHITVPETCILHPHTFHIIRASNRTPLGLRQMGNQILIQVTLPAELQNEEHLPFYYWSRGNEFHRLSLQHLHSQKLRSQSLQRNTDKTEKGWLNNVLVIFFFLLNSVHTKKTKNK